MQSLSTTDAHSISPQQQVSVSNSLSTHSLPRDLATNSAGFKPPVETVASYAYGKNEQLAEWMSAVVRGDQCAFSNIYNTTVNKIHGLVFSILRNHEDTEEVLCDIYLKLWNNAHQFNPQRGSVMAWLMTLARSKALDCYRKRSRCRSVYAEICALQVQCELVIDDVELNGQNAEERSAILNLIAELPEQQLNVLYLAFFRDHSHQEVANTLNLPLGTVKSHIRRTIKKLRESMEI